MSTFYELPAVGGTVTLVTHLTVREDAHVLYGFSRERDRDLFRALIKVTGVGPKIGLAILSGMDAARFAQSVEQEDIASLTRLPGIGTKTAQRLVVEMRDRLDGILSGLPAAPAAAGGRMVAEGADQALRRCHQRPRRPGLQARGRQPHGARRGQGRRGRGTEVGSPDIRSDHPGGPAVGQRRLGSRRPSLGPVRAVELSGDVAVGCPRPFPPRGARAWNVRIRRAAVLVIRREQMRALEGAQTGLFADELVAHIQGFAPTLFASMGNDAVRATVSMGLKNALGYGFTIRGPARFYVEAMFMLGSFFDTDPQYRAITPSVVRQGRCRRDGSCGPTVRKGNGFRRQNVRAAA